MKKKHPTYVKPAYEDYEVILLVNGREAIYRVWGTSRKDAGDYIKNVLRHAHPTLLQAHKVTPEVTL